MTHKPFDQGLYEHNNPAINDWIRHLHKSGWQATTNPDKYGVDVLAQSPTGNPMNFEVEVKHNWVGPSFQFKTVHIPGRKLKFADDKTTFVIFNHERGQAFLVKGTLIKNSPTIKKKTLYTDNEEFFEIHTDYCQHIPHILT